MPYTEWSETRRNIATNQSFEIYSSTTEVWRNLHDNPVLATNSSGFWSSSGLTARKEVDIPDYDWIDYAWWSGADPVSVGVTRPVVATFDGLTPGQDYTVSMLAINHSSGWQLGVWDGVIASPGAPTIKAESLSPSDVWRLLSITFTAASSSASVGLYASASMSSEVYGIAAPTVVAGIAAPPLFSGDYSTDSDLEPSWTSTPNSSPSVLRGEFKWWMQNGIAVRSGQWSKYGSYSMRSIATHPTSTDTSVTVIGSSANMGPFENGKTYTMLVTVHLKEDRADPDHRPYVQIVWNDKAGWSGASSQNVYAEHTAGDYELRSTFTVPEDAVWFAIRLQARTKAGGADVWWDGFLVVEGEYEGEYFDGSFGDGALSRYTWMGTAYDSESIWETRSFIYPDDPIGSKALAETDILVEYRDKDLVRRGSIPAADMVLKFQPVFNGVGSWSVKLPAEHRAVPFLRAPGSGVVITNLRTGDVILSGSTSKPTKRETIADKQGMVTVSGLSDDRLLWDGRAYPQPSNDDVSTQTESHDVRTGNAESLMRAYVAYNLCSTHNPAGRQGGLRDKLRLETVNKQLGAWLTKRARFPKVGDLLAEISAESGLNLGFRVVQVDNLLEFQVYQPSDLRAEVRLDVINGTLQEQVIEFAPPEVTREIVAGQGEGVDRQIVMVTTPDSLAAEDQWGLIIEEFKDQRQTNDTDELISAGLGELETRGFTKVAVKATPTNDQTMVYMQDFFQGDIITVIIDGQETSSIITEAAVVVDENGVRTAVGIGNIADFDRDSALRQTVNDNSRRISDIERNVEVGMVVPATTTTPGVVELATPGENITGTSQTLATTPKSVSDTIADRLAGWAVPNANLPARLREYAATITDWNDARANGWYMGNGATNAPAAGWVLGYVEAHNDLYVTQTVHFFTSDASPDPKVFRRGCDNGTWGSWYELQLSMAEQDARYAALAHSHAWSDITGKPSTFPPSSHTHNASDITMGTLASGRLPAASETAQGASERATQAETDSGADDVRFVTPKKLRSRAYAPYAEASGITASSGTAGGSAAPVYWDGTTTIALPAGRFTQPPAVVVSVQMGGGVMWADLTTAPTTTEFVVRLMRINAYPGSAPIHWHAVQMTS